MDHAEGAGRQRLIPELELNEVQGSKPGSRYVRVTRRRDRLFQQIEEGEYRATQAALKPRSAVEGLWLRFKRIVVGTPLATSQLVEERLGKLKALAVFSSNNLSSSAYATEEILLILVLAGTGAFKFSIPIAATIGVLVAIVALSYSQVIRGYPNGGGSYVVAKENLGLNTGLVAGSSLIVDYTLTVAVSTAAGVAAITSAVPELHDQRTLIAVALVIALTFANLRGLREAGTLVAVPTYFFILSFAGLIVVGLVRLALGHDLHAGTPSEIIEPGTSALGLFLILRAFSSGSAALTGIEAVSNGVPSFNPPEARNANVTLAWMVVILTFFFIGLSILAYQLDATPSESKTIVAQVAEGVFGKTAFFYAIQLATTLILILAANTSFVGLPALASVMAQDKTLPHQFAFRGDRLAFSYGIVVLGLASIALLILFQADTHALIPLYAVGVFIGFTLSQGGLSLRWWREGTAAARRSMVINAIGAVATGVVAVIITITKFVEGAWITIASIAFLAFVFKQINDHYMDVEQQLDVGTRKEAEPVRTAPVKPGGSADRAVVVPVDEINRAVARTIDYAQSISGNITAVHVTDDLEVGERLKDKWESEFPNVPLLVIESPYRSILAPLLAYIDALDRADPDAYITVVLPEYVPAHFWEGILHNQTAVPLKRALLHRPHTVIIDVPYHLK